MSDEQDALLNELSYWLVGELGGLESLARSLVIFNGSLSNGPLVVDEHVLINLADDYAQRGLRLPYLIVRGIAYGFEKSPSSDNQYDYGFVDGAYIHLCEKVWRHGGGSGVVFLPGLKLDIIRSGNSRSIIIGEGPLYGEESTPGFVVYNCLCAATNTVRYVPKAYGGIYRGVDEDPRLEGMKKEVVGGFISFITDKNFPEVLRSFQR